MTQFRGLLNDEEIASVLTYVRNSFGNKSSAVSPTKVKEVRARNQQRGFWKAEELLQKYPNN